MAMCMSPYMIGGGLTMGGGNFCFSNPQGSYQCAYNSALKVNQTNYCNILKGYQGLMQSQVCAQNKILQGYGALCGKIQGTIQGVECAQLKAAQCVYTKNAGNIQNQMISGGLNVSSALCAAARGNAAQYTLAQCQARSSFGQLKAGYMANVGEAGLNYQNQANMQNTALGVQQLKFMCGVSAPYPCVGLYAKQANANMARLAGTGGFGQVTGSANRKPSGPGQPARAGNPGTPYCQGGYGGGAGGGIFSSYCKPSCTCWEYQQGMAAGGPGGGGGGGGGGGYGGSTGGGCY